MSRPTSKAFSCIPVLGPYDDVVTFYSLLVQNEEFMRDKLA